MINMIKDPEQFVKELAESAPNHTREELIATLYDQGADKALPPKYFLAVIREIVKNVYALIETTNLEG
jgi:hypothetical protein